MDAYKRLTGGWEAAMGAGFGVTDFLLAVGLLPLGIAIGEYVTDGKRSRKELLLGLFTAIPLLSFSAYVLSRMLFRLLDMM